MKIALGTFARSGIEARLGIDISAGVQAALLHYARRLRSGWPPVEFPRFSVERPSDGSSVELELSVDARIQEALRLEALRQGVTVEQLLVHAVLVYLADLDSTESTPGPPLQGSRTLVDVTRVLPGAMRTAGA